jgi:hypothetical protein
MFEYNIVRNTIPLYVLSQTDLCELCFQNVLDKFEQFVCYCSEVNKPWKHVIKKLHVTITVETALFGLLIDMEEEYKKANKLLLLAKKCISFINMPHTVIWQRGEKRTICILFIHPATGCMCIPLK